MRKSGTYGTGSVFQKSFRGDDGKITKGKRWYVQYPCDGRIVREATGTTIYKDALQVLKDRLAGKLPNVAKTPADVVNIEMLFEYIRQDYRKHGYTSIGTLEKSRFPPLRDYFKERDLSKLTIKDINDYRRHREKQKARTGRNKGKPVSGSTINREVFQIHNG